MSLTAGGRLGAYELVAPLGAGGMGEVWRGRDPRLGREVAIKVLPTHVSGDAMALARFEREARAVAALSHPHILAIHDFASADGYAFTVTELLEGETLRARLADGAVPVRRAAEWGAQVARALAAAHDKKIVHRDIKPDNLFVTREGRIKVLDFGLAFVEPRAAAEEGKTTGVRLRTDPGRLIGTVGYMSPEQVRGERIDSRSDIFSLGCVLYEMVTGQRPFHRGSPADTLAAILLEDPPGLGTEGSGGAGRVIPSAFARIVRHCLEKEPGERFQNARDLAFDLESLADATTATPVSGVGELPPAARPRQRSAARWAPLGALLVGFAAGGAAVWWALPREAEPPSRLRVITHAGNEAWPTVSPDGRLIAFASERDGGSRIWLRQMASGDEVALTSGVDSLPRFSPDGASLLFLRRRPDGGDLFRVATVGGDPRRAIPDAVGGDWSPDGRQIGFVRGRLRTRWTVGVAASDGGGERILSRDHPLPLAQPRWSPDGRYLAVLRRTSLTGSADSVLLFEPEGGGHRVLRSRRGSAVSSLAWAGRSTLLLAVPEGAAARTPSTRLMSYELGSGTARTLLWVPYVVPSMEVMGEGRVVLTAVVPRQNLRELARDGSGGERWRSRGTTVDRQPVYSPDGGRVVFSSTRGGNLDLWALDEREGALQRLTNDPAEDWDPALTPDGQRLLWSSDRTGHFEVWVAEPDGRAARQLTRDGADAQNPSAAPGGWVVYTSGNRRYRGLWRIGLDGSGAERLVEGVAMHPEVSPDGRYVLYDAPTADGQEVRVVRLADGGHEPFRVGIPFRNLPISGGLSSIPIALGRSRWRPDGRAIAYVALDGEGGVGIFEQGFEPGRPAAGPPSLLVRSEGELITESHGFSPDGTRLLVSFIERTPNLVVAERVPGVAAPLRRGG